MSVRKKAIFSNDGELFAFASEQGSLKIWETSSNILKQEYVLSSHANLTCSCLTWGPSKNEINMIDKSETVGGGSLSSENQYLIIGTEEGAVLLYNFEEGKLSNNFATSHTNSVNDVCYHLETNSVFSCSSDKTIIIWDMASEKLKSKWEADDEPLYSICVIDSDNLLSASTSILWWNINEQTVIKKFNGHESAISTLLTVSSTDLSTNSYFLSAAVGESKISAWHLEKSNSKTIVASFDLSDELQSIDVTKNFSKDKPMFLSTVTKGGSLLLFKHVLNGKIKKKVTPQMTLHVVSKPTGEYSEPSSIPVLSSKFSQCSESSIIAYGSFENPTFEKVKIIDCPKTLTLARDKTLHHKDSSVEVIPSVKLYNKHGEYISANGELPDLNSSYLSCKRRKQKDPVINTLDTEDDSDESKAQIPDHKTFSNSSVKKKKLRKIDKEVNISRSPKTHTANIENTILSEPSSITNSLLQYIETDDRALLNMVLQVNDDQLIRHSVESLPTSSLVPVLIKLHTILINREQKYITSSIKWMTVIGNVHLIYLRNCKDNTSEEIVEILDLIKEYIDSKKVNETRLVMSKLNGLLNIWRIQRTFRECHDSDKD